MALDIKIIKSTNDYLTFHIKSNSYELTNFVNCIRIAMIANIKTLAIETMKIIDYRSTYADFIIATRLGLLPIKRKYDYIKTANFKLNVKFDINKADSNGYQIIYSSDIISETEDVDIINKDIPIIILQKYEYLNLSLEATEGIGKIHAKWNPCCVSYKEINSKEYEFMIETLGQYSCLELFLKGIEHLTDLCDKYIDSVEDIVSE